MNAEPNGFHADSIRIHQRAGELSTKYPWLSANEIYFMLREAMDEDEAEERLNRAEQCRIAA